MAHPHHLRVRVLAHIKRLDDCFGDFLVRVVCECGASREIEPEALARTGPKEQAGLARYRVLEYLARGCAHLARGLMLRNCEETAIDRYERARPPAGHG